MERGLLLCKNCRTLARGAHESQCCGLLYCDDCSQNGNLQCPNCHQENLICKPNLFLSRMLGSGDNVRTFWVNQPGFDPAIPLVNENGLTALLGASGKYYCGQPRECCHLFLMSQHPNCGCVCCTKDDDMHPSSGIVGRCGPTTGCNCLPCQKLDIAARGLPSNWLIAPDGTMAKWQADKFHPYCGKFTCGRRYEIEIKNPKKNWMEKMADAVKGTVQVQVRYCGQGNNVCPSCTCLHDHVMFGNQYRPILGLPNIEMTSSNENNNIAGPSTSA